MQSFKEVWDKVLTVIEPQVSKVSFESWIKLLQPVKMEKNVATLYVRTLFQKGTIQNNFETVIKNSFTEVMGFPIEISIITEAEAPPRIIEKGEKTEAEVSESIGKKVEYISGDTGALTFENFVVGSENKFAHAAAYAVANNPGHSYNPLLIWGRSGVGKTHLMHAIANQIRANNPEAKVLYIRCEEFVNDMVESLKKGQMKEFRSKYRYVDALLVDDIQFIAHKESTQDEFFYTFETLFEAKAQIVLTSDRPPNNMLTLEERLRTRIASDIIADIQPPEYEMRCAIIKQKAEMLGMELPEEIVDFIAKKLTTSVREIQGAINRIKAYSALNGIRPNLEIAQSAVHSVVTENIASAITVELIIDAVSRYYNIPITDIKGKRQNASISQARKIAMYISRNLTSLSLKEIGVEFGGKDHTTVLYSCNKIDDLIQTDPKLNREVSELIENIKKSF